MLEIAVAVFAVSAAFGLLATRGGRAVADRIGLRDRPDGRRKIHAKPVAVVGGLALLVAVPAGLTAAVVFLPEVGDLFAANPGRWVSLLAASAVLAAVGVLDDARNLRARYKLVGQLTAVALLIGGGGFLIREVTAFGLTVPLGEFAILFTLAWFVFAINALNLLDGMDGMLGAVGGTIFLGLAVLASLTSGGFGVLVAVAAAGGLAGFLRYNLPPATVYLGDCGSMLIGMLVAALAIDASVKGPAFAVLTPLALLVLPLLDTTAAVVRRKLTGRGLAIGDRGHLHHMLLRRGLSVRQSLLVVAGFGGLAATGAVLSVLWRSDLIAAVTAAAVVATLALFGLFGLAELRLIRARAGSAIRKVAGGRTVEVEVRLQGTHGWGGLWEGIVSDAQALQLTAVCLDVNAPAWHEGYHRRWARADAADDPLTVWRVELPLMAHGQLVGRLTVSGERADGCMAEKLAALSVVVRAAESLMATTPPDGVRFAEASRVPPAAADSTPPTPLPA